MRWKTGSSAVALSALLAGLGGCERPAPARQFELVTGTVELVNSETGEVLVRTRSPAQPRGPSETLRCQVTQDTEIYISDGLVHVSELSPGDPVELIGYHDTHPAPMLVVVVASVPRAGPAPPAPDLPAVVWPEPENANPGGP